MLVRVLVGMAAATVTLPALLAVVRRSSTTAPSRWHYAVLMLAAPVAGGAVALWPQELYAAGAALILIALPAATVDLVEKRIPDRLTLPMAVIALVTVAFPAVIIGDLWLIVRCAAAGAAWAAVLLVLNLVTGHPGPGDVKYAIGLGVVLGWTGWYAVAAGAAGTYLLAAVVLLPLLALRVVRLRGSIPLAPAMLTATIAITTAVAVM